MPVSITASEARKNLFGLIERVNDDHHPVEITSRNGDAVLLAKADYEALAETDYLLRVPANARRLLESMAGARGGEEMEIDNFAQAFKGEQPLRMRRPPRKSRAAST
jgi:antitoxin YefM